MGRDNQPKSRQLSRQAQKNSRRASYERILIVSEGSKTEPLYFEEIRAAYQLHSANVEVQPSQLGTAPIQVVQYARQLFEQGDLVKRIRPKCFDQVFAVFDRDDHQSYFDALNLAESINGKLKNDNNQPVQFKAIASVPSFELWLLLHYEDVLAPMHRTVVFQRLKKHTLGYEKGASDMFAKTHKHVAVAMQRAHVLADRFNAHTAPEPYTGIAELVTLLLTLRA